MRFTLEQSSTPISQQLYASEVLRLLQQANPALCYFLRAMVQLYS